MRRTNPKIQQKNWWELFHSHQKLLSLAIFAHQILPDIFKQFKQKYQTLFFALISEPDKIMYGLSQLCVVQLFDVLEKLVVQNFFLDVLVHCIVPTFYICL